LVWGSQGLLMGLQRPETPNYSKISLKWVRLYLVTLKPQYNDPFNNKIPAIKNLISSLFVVNFIVKSTSNNKTSAIKHKIFHPFRFIKPIKFKCFKSQMA
jgi:hypothetical protein